MLTVWTMCTGDAYSLDYVQVLRRMVKRHLSVPHEFVCITEHDVNGIITMKPPTSLPGWWGKIGLFKSGVQTYKNLWLDLDVVVTGSLDELCKPLESHKLIRTGLNWAQSGHGGCQSSVMYWEGGPASIIYNTFDPKLAHWPPINKSGVMWGDQEHITALRDEGRLAVEYFSADQVVSYKYHCRDGLPPAASVVVFHGKPDPHEVADPWVIKCRR